MNRIRYMDFDRCGNAMLLISRVLMVLLFITFGIPKMIGFNDTVNYMISLKVPFPVIAAITAVLMEKVGAILIILGMCTRLLAMILALYILAIGVFGHAYWNISLDALLMKENIIDFYKNISIAGGFMLLVVIGPGKWSLDRR